MKAIEFLEHRIRWAQTEVDEAIGRREQVQLSIDGWVAERDELEAELDKIKAALDA